MAEQKRKKRVIKKAETVREKASKAADAKPKPRRIHKTFHKVKSPIGKFFKLIAKLLRPFRFLLWPFKTRPARFIGRILGKILLINYIRASWKELKLVEWPDRRSVMKLTGAVFVFAIVFAVLISVIDYGLDKLFKSLILN